MAMRDGIRDDRRPNLRQTGATLSPGRGSPEKTQALGAHRSTGSSPSEIVLIRNRDGRVPSHICEGKLRASGRTRDRRKNSTDVIESLENSPYVGLPCLDSIIVGSAGKRRRVGGNDMISRPISDMIANKIGRVIRFVKMSERSMCLDLDVCCAADVLRIGLEIPP
jgi:hypothetical protein